MVATRRSEDATRPHVLDPAPTAAAPRGTFDIREATAAHVASCSTIVPRAFHAHNEFIRTCFPDTAALAGWWSRVFEDEIGSASCHVLVATEGGDGGGAETHEVVGVLCMRLMEPDDRSAGLYSRYPFTPDHQAALFRPAADAMVAARTAVFGATGKRHWLIELLGVDGRYRGRGLGRRLLERCAEIADRSGYDSFVEANASAAGIYVKLGFESQGSVMMPGEITYEEFMLVRRCPSI